MEETHDGETTTAISLHNGTDCVSPENRIQSTEIKTDECYTTENNVYKDKGWAWIIAVAAMVSVFLAVGAYRYLALLLVELTDIYEEPATKLALILTWNGIGFCGCACLYIMGFGEVFLERIMMAASGIIIAFGFISAYLSTKLEHLYILGFCAGFSAQFGQMAGMNLVGEYFDKRLALANGLVASGVSLGTLILPPFVQILFDEYGYRGTSLIMAGLSLNLLVCAALMRPVKKKVQKTKEPWLPNDMSKDVNTNDLKKVNNFVQSKNDPIRDISPHSTNCVDEPVTIDTNDTRNVQQVAKSDISTTDRLKINVYSDDKCVEGHSQNAKAGRSKEVITSFGNKAFVGELEPEYLYCNGTNSSNSVHTEPSRDKTSKTIVQIVQTFLLKPKPINSHGQRSSKLKSLLLGFSYFKDPAFILFQLFAVLVTLAAECLVQFTPTLAVDLGSSQSESGYLLSIIGAGDLISRITTGFLGDHLDRILMVAIPQFILGVSCFLHQFATQFWSQVIFVVIVGGTYGVSYAFETVLLIDYFGLSGLSRTLGMTNLLSGLGFIAGGPIVGLLRDLTGNYLLSVQFLGSCFFISGFCVIGVKLTRRCCPVK